MGWERAEQYAHDALGEVEQLLQKESASGLSQPTLRRAVSSLYYAAFHLTTRGGAEALFSDKNSIDIVARSFEHTQMLQSFRSYLSESALRNPSNRGGKLFGDASTRVIELISKLTLGFEQLQTERHRADYDFSTNTTFSKQKALQLLDLAREYIDALTELHAHHPAEYSRMMVVLLFKRLSKIL